MTVLKNLGAFVAFTLGVAFLVSFFLPSAWEVSREVQVQMEPRSVHSVIGDLETWKAWSPWGIMVDGGVQMTAQGKSLTWSGSEVGSGSLVVTADKRDEGLWFDLVLRGNPIKGVFQYELLRSGATKVTWTLRGEVGSNPLGRYTVLFRRYTMGPELVAALTRVKKRIQNGF